MGFKTGEELELLIRKARVLMEADAEGEHFEEICDQLRMYQASLRTVFTLEAYDNLIKNGDLYRKALHDAPPADGTQAVLRMIEEIQKK